MRAPKLKKPCTAPAVHHQHEGSTVLAYSPGSAGRQGEDCVDWAIDVFVRYGITFAVKPV